MRRAIEITWMVVAAVSLVEAVYHYRKSGLESDNFLIFSLVFLLAVFMYFLRRYQRLRSGR